MSAKEPTRQKKVLEVFVKSRFWLCAVILLLVSPIVAFAIYQTLDQLVSANYHLGAIWASSEDARYILSALSQAQAAILEYFSL